MSSSRSIAAARSRRAGETQPPVSGGRPGTSIASHSAFVPQQQQMPPPQVMPIRPGNPEMVSTPLYNVAPNVGMQEGNDMGLPNLLSRMPLSEEELLRLQQQLQTTGYRGR